eukprot:GEMP01012377.1.p1 GENE.GEMP01012377.1~~GEMP01012377.1.p1  ORF type:complete len:761 (-),score=142.45 GEMP01012377.1:268-2550(-)
MLTSALYSIANYTAEVLPQLAVQYGPVSLVELGLFFLTCVIVFFYSWFTNPQRIPSNKRGWWTNDANCVKSQHCASAILQLCQSRSSHHKGLQMYLDHRDHLTSAKNPHMSDWESFFYHLLIAVSRCGPPQLSSEIFAHRRSLGAPPSTALYEVAMKMLAGKHLYTEALKVYDESYKDGLTLSPVSYSCLINFAIEVEQPHRAIAFFEKLSEITTPSIRAYMSILRLYSRKKAWKESVSILNHMQSRKVPLDSLVLNIVLGACVRAEELTVAGGLLEKYDNVRDVISFNNILKGYAQTHQYQEALAMVGRMKRTGVKPTMVTYNTVMDACVRSRQYQHAWEVAEAAEFPADKYTLSILVKTIGTMRWKIPTLLDYLQKLKIDDPQSALPVIFTTIVETLNEEPNIESLQRVMKEARRRNVVLSFPCLTTLLRCQWNLGAAELAFGTWTDLLGNRMPPMTFFQTALELAFHLRKSGNEKPFMDMLQWIKSKKAYPEVDALIQLMVKMLLRLNQLDEAMTIYYDITNVLKTVKSRKPNFDQAFYTQLIKAQMGYDEFHSATAIQHAMKLIEDVRSQGLQPEPQSIICILQSCLRHSDMEGARTALLGIQLMGVRPTEHALATVLRLQLKVEEWDEAIKLLQTMKQAYGVLPTTGTISLVMQGFAKASRDDKVLELYTWMRSTKFMRDVSICNTALSVCASKNNFVRGMEVAHDAVQQNIKPREGLTEFLGAVLRGGNSSIYNAVYRLMAENDISVPCSFPVP